MAWRRFCASALFACSSGYGTFHEQQTCTNDAPAGTHVRGSYSWNDKCVLDCVAGFLDCDGKFDDGCEVEGACPKPPPPPPPGEQLGLLVDLDDAPNGVAVCNAHVYFLDGASLKAVDPNVQGTATSIGTSPSTPAGGLACDGASLYWPVASGIVRFTLADDSQTNLVSGVDPGRGIDTRGSTIYWIARTGFGDAGAMLVASDDAGSSARLPITEGSAYKSFALTTAGDFAIHDTDVNALTDAGLSTSAFGAPATALFSGTSPTAYAVTASGWIVRADAPSTALVTGLPTIVATASSGDTVVLASDATVYAVQLTTKSLKPLDGPFLHIAYIATDGAHAFFVSRGEGAEKAALWKTPVLP